MLVFDKFFRYWDFPLTELCTKCGQPDSCGDCNHERLSEDEVKKLGGFLVLPSKSQLKRIKVQKKERRVS